MADEVAPYGSDEEVLEVLRRFESCEFEPGEFGHRRHLTVALLYLLESGYAGGLERMRSGLHRFVGRHGLAGVYHETLTVFWVRRVRAFVEQSDTTRGLAALANELARACADSRLASEYYSKARLESDKARAYWLDSDLKPLDF